jgi:NADH-quinone oxidoreductase subunit F
MVFYGAVTAESATLLVERYLIHDDPLPEFALGTVGDERIDSIPCLFDTPVFKLQKRRILRNCGFIDPSNIDHSIAHDGYSGLKKALTAGSDWVIDEIKKSGLRGRGGAGFPTWRKWRFCKDALGDEKYIFCNGSEGDPGSFSNRLLLESDPHSVLEGMLIAGYAVGAEKGYIYCPLEYQLALKRVKIAIDQMKDYGLLGNGILGSSFNFNITIKQGAGAYICGEETALIEFFEGKRGIPRFRPPFPPISGLWDNPTIINNVETLACVTLILQKGSQQFAELGTKNSRGTKAFSLSGNIQRCGLFEAPLGITLEELVFTIGGGASDNRAIKAVHTGGPGGGCLPINLLNTPVDDNSLLNFGSSMGSGGVIVMDESTCMVDVALNFLDFFRKESCGSCVPCRLGIEQMFEIVRDITEGRGKPEDIDLLIELGEAIKKGSFCGLGQTAPNPVLSTIRYFRNEYEAHIDRKECPVAACKRINLSGEKVL